MTKKPTKGSYLEVILRSPKTVFSTKDIALLWRESNNTTITNRIKKYILTGKLIRVRKGFYAKDEHYDRFELAARIYTPSYISFETVLTREGVNFQFYGNIFVASYLNREIRVGDQNITYIRMKETTLRDTTGIERHDGVAWATKERAFLDRLYVSRNYHFDHPEALNWERVFEILPIYDNKRLERYVLKYHKSITEEQPL